MKKIYATIFAAVGLSIAMAALTVANAAELKLAHFMSPKHPYHPLVFERLAKEIAEATNGEVTIRVYPGGELGPGPVQQFNRAVDGVADIAFGVHGYTAPKFRRSLLMEYPGVASSPAAATDAYWKAIDLIKDEYKRVKLLGLWNIPPASLFLRDKPVRSLEDIKGLKIRVATKGHGEIVKAWGGVPVFIPVPQVYNAMQTGVVDGVLIESGAALAFKLMEVSKYMTVGMDTPMATFFLVMNKDSWNRLSDDQKAALDKLTGNRISKIAYQSWLGISKKGADVMAKKRQVIQLAPEEAAKFNAASAKVLAKVVADLEAKGIPAKKVVEAMSAN